MPTMTATYGDFLDFCTEMSGIRTLKIEMHYNPAKAFKVLRKAVGEVAGEIGSAHYVTLKFRIGMYKWEKVLEAMAELKRLEPGDSLKPSGAERVMLRFGSLITQR